MRNIRELITWFQPKFHVFTVACTLCFLGWELYNYEIQKPEITDIIEIILPSILNSFTGENPVKPTDFVNNLN